MMCFETRVVRCLSMACISRPEQVATWNFRCVRGCLPTAEYRKRNNGRNTLAPFLGAPWHPRFHEQSVMPRWEPGHGCHARSLLQCRPFRQHHRTEPGQEPQMDTMAAVKLISPALLFALTLGMGMTLRVSDIRQLFQSPRAVAVGLFCQMVLLPLTGLALVTLV